MPGDEMSYEEEMRRLEAGTLVPSPPFAAGDDVAVAVATGTVTLVDVDGFAALRKANIARNREWAMGTTLSLSFRGNELAGEVGEACNIIKKLDREALGLVGSRATLPDLAAELADVVICVDLIAMDLGIDLRQAVAEKFNATSVARGLLTRMEVV